MLLVTLAALVAFDLAAASALRRYLYTQTDSQLTNVLSMYRPLNITVRGRPPRPNWKVSPKIAHVQVHRSGGFSVVGPPMVLRPALIDQYFVGFLPTWPILPPASDHRPCRA